MLFPEKPKGQSRRAYAWWDTSGGVVVVGRRVNNYEDIPSVRLSFPELLQLSQSFIKQLTKDARPGETLEQTAERLHKGFYEAYDDKHVEQINSFLAQYQNLSVKK